MNITWNKYFDKIYCLHYIPFKERKELMDFQLKRIGILDSGIFSYYLTYNNALDKKFERFFRYSSEKIKNNIFINTSIFFGHYNVIREAYAHDYNRILIIEDDVRFLRDLNKIEQVLNNRPQNADIILYDKFLYSMGDFNKLALNKVNDYYAKFSRCTSAGCYQLNRKGMKRIIELTEKEPQMCDCYFYSADQSLTNLNYYCSIENLAIQSTFSDAQQNITENNSMNYHRLYKYQNIDFDKYMMRKDGSPFYYGDLIDQLKTQKYNDIIKVTDQYSYNINDQVNPANMNICFAVTNNHFDKLLPIIYSFKKYSNKDSKFNFYIITDDKNLEKYYLQLEPFKDQRTNFKIVDATEYMQQINVTFNHWRTFMSYMKLFIPTLFPEVDKILYVDYDTMIFNKGIENFYNLDFEDNYLIATEDFLSTCGGLCNLDTNFFLQYQIFNILTKHYFNSGVLLINSKKIREEGFDKQIKQFLKQDRPDDINNSILHNVFKILSQKRTVHPRDITFKLTDQSVFNFLFADKKVKIISNIFNLMVLGCNNFLYERYLREKWGLSCFQQAYEKSVILHINKLKYWAVVPENEVRLTDLQFKAIEKCKTIKKEMEEVLK